MSFTDVTRQYSYIYNLLDKDINYSGFPSVHLHCGFQGLKMKQFRILLNMGLKSSAVNDCLKSITHGYHQMLCFLH